MNLCQSILEALESLNANKLRSGLTILGIVIGVAAVIAMLAVGAGAQETITSSISGIGSNLLFVFSGNFSEEVTECSALDHRGCRKPCRTRFRHLPSQALHQSSGEAFRSPYGGKNASTSVEGVTPDYATVRNYNVTEGEFINSEQVLGRASVALLGPDVAEKLFDSAEWHCG